MIIMVRARDRVTKFEILIRLAGRAKHTRLEFTFLLYSGCTSRKFCTAAANLDRCQLQCADLGRSLTVKTLLRRWLATVPTRAG
jgi:hypothetical protein